MSESAVDKAPSPGTLAGLVPELYFDLISRVPAGVILLAFLATDPDLVTPPIALRDLNFAKIVVFAFLGYAAGLVLNGIGGIALVWTRRWMWRTTLRRDPCARSDIEWFARRQNPDVASSARWTMRETDAYARHLHDYLRVCHRDFRALLPKLAAETALCANLMVAFLGVALVSEEPRRAFALAATLLCLVALLFREWSSTQRHCSFLALARQLTPKTAGESTARTEPAAHRAR